MHDGYLYTLGICGTASDASAAPGLLNRLLGALPPVKRAALLSDVRLGDADDALIDAVIADFADAELLLLLAPTVGGALPPHMAATLKQAAQQHTLAGKHALLLALAEEGDPPATHALQQLQRWCEQAGVQVAGALALPPAASDELLAAAVALAQQTYEQASAALLARGIAHAR